jgi:excisionase family DNA binding protein
VTTSTDSTHTLTVAEAAQILGVSERTIWRYLKSGRLDGETVGRAGAQRTLIPRACVDELRVERGQDPEVDELRAERDRLVGELARAQAEREAMRARVDAMQRAIAHRSSLAGTLERAFGAISRMGRTGMTRRVSTS